MAFLTTQPAAEPQPIDIEAWTEEATAAISTVTISAPEETVHTVSIQIPLDDVSTTTRTAERPTSATAAAKQGGQYKRKEPLRRDSMKRREALLKGNEGSRRRMRWENGTRPPTAWLNTRHPLSSLK